MHATWFLHELGNHKLALSKANLIRNLTHVQYTRHQAAVYLARAAKGPGARPRQLHAPARRLARTTISLGPEEGIMFGLRSIR